MRVCAREWVCVRVCACAHACVSALFLLFKATFASWAASQLCDMSQLLSPSGCLPTRLNGSLQPGVA